jgi:polyphosphate kinase
MSKDKKIDQDGLSELPLNKIFKGNDGVWNDKGSQNAPKESPLAEVKKQQKPIQKVEKSGQSEKITKQENKMDKNGEKHNVQLEENIQLKEENTQLKEKLRKLKKKTAKAVKRRQEEQFLKPFQAELIKLQHHLEETNTRMVVLFEGRDAAGKGGTLRRMTRYMNEKHYRVVALGKPTEEQKTQWFFQKYVAQLPRGGEVVLFDRSWYNRAMVEPVFGFCSDKQYEDFMTGVTGFEKDMVRQGTIMLKLYFSVSKDEQAFRFGRRKVDPLRQWKLSEVDIQAQERWDDFTNMKYSMLKRTHTSDAPWTIIRSDDKSQARFNAIKVILNAVSYKGRDPKPDFRSDPEIVVSGARELELMDAQRIRDGHFTD